MGSHGPGFRIIITGGGTGGHLFPALAVAEEFISRFSDTEILFVGTSRYIDSQVLSKGGFDVKSIRCGALKGGTLVSRIKTLFSLPLGLCQSIAVIRKFKPDLVFGVGGYVTGPVIAAAKMMGILACIHEQNSVPGMANRKLGRFVDQIFLSIPGSENYFPAKKCYLSGNPVRSEFLAKKTEDSGLKSNSLDDNRKVLLVIGGSQGAHQLNHLVPKALNYYKNELPHKFMVVHQTGPAEYEIVQKAYKDAKIQAQAGAFFNNMADLIRQADLVVCRAGATTLAELTVLHKSSILVPYQFAADGHQEKNGEFLVQVGAAQMFKQVDLDEKLLGKSIITLLHDDKLRKKMGDNAGKLAKPEAASEIVEKCVELIERR